jgi:cytidylate kinase
MKYMKELIKIILTLGYRGEVIILDHGANFILPEGHGLRVRITAPHTIRLQRAREYETKTELQARETLRAVEKDRREFVQQYFEKSIDDTNNYDLVVNTTFYSMEDTADIIERALYRKFPNYRKKRRFLLGKA